MFLRKRPRRPIKRTPSLRELSLDLGAAEGPSDGDLQQRKPQRPAVGMEGVAAMNSYNSNGSTRGQQQHQYQNQGPWEGLDTNYVFSVPPPRNPRRHSADFVVQPATFLRVCGFCKQRLGPGRDTFMYRGEVAFCSLECRQQQMNLDERNEQCFLSSMKRDLPQFAPKSEASGDSKP